MMLYLILVLPIKTLLIDGYLWDLDSGDGEYLTSGGDIPCPFCNPIDHLEYQLNDDQDKVICSCAD